MKSSIENKASSLLSREENEQVFRLFGMKCLSLATAVVQLFVTQGPDHSHWIKKDSGVMCFIKDNVRRNYFFRFYCLSNNKMIWEQELYNFFDYKTPEDYFHLFEIDHGIAGLNFASESEAHTMKIVINEKLALKRQRREERKSRNSLQSKNATSVNSNIHKPAYNSNMNITNDSYKYNQPSSIPFIAPQKQKKKTTKITKDDIGLPENFVHISHVGWDPNKGFDINIDDPQLRKFFNKAGVSDRQLKDKETRDFIYDFINTHGGLDRAKSEVNAESSQKSPNPSPRGSNNQIGPTPPPVPARTPVNRCAPPPPPMNKAKPPPPPSARGQPPPRPVPIQLNTVPDPPAITNNNNNNSVPAPPPPPPMTDFNVPPPPPITRLASAPLIHLPSVVADSRSALLESIRAGKSLKPVEVERKPSVGDSRGDLLNEIRQGIELKPVQNCQRPSSGPTCQENSLAEALSNALKARAFAIHSESDSDSGNSTDDDDEWEQDD